ncbi:hypothetical protein PQI07_22600 [Methylobacterium sp. 092160098-2]|uniref:hypothetical protein n=1 Tax=Methylobacterium sp. 092160098-2 TaxID=3025129 RepID=UPI002381B332|nr:hypothetical protein [Methylobacterium sp. 092160098-2]MDE4913474.1 hypothetical protein [Methylobacterium sp. 092160098-2]
MTREEAENIYYRSRGTDPDLIRRLDALNDAAPHKRSAAYQKSRDECEAAIVALMEQAAPVEGQNVGQRRSTSPPTLPKRRQSAKARPAASV